MATWCHGRRRERDGHCACFTPFAQFILVKWPRQINRSPAMPKMLARRHPERGLGAAPYRARIRSIGRVPRLPHVGAIPAIPAPLIRSLGPHQARRAPPVRDDHRRARYRQPPGRPTACAPRHTLCLHCRRSCPCTQCRALGIIAGKSIALFQRPGARNLWWRAQRMVGASIDITEREQAEKQR